MTRPRDSEGGFVLLEALAVLALSGLVVLTLLAIGNLTTRNSEVTSARADEIERFATGLSALRRDLDSALYVQASLDEGRVLFIGEPNRIGLAVAGGQSSGGGDSLVMISARSGPGGGLIRSVRRLTPDATAFSGGEWNAPVALVSGPWRFRFSYGAPGPAGLQWQRAWSQPAKLPAAIRVDVADIRSGRGRSPPLVVPLRVNMRPGCVDGVGQAC